MTVAFEIIYIHNEQVVEARKNNAKTMTSRSFVYVVVFGHQVGQSGSRAAGGRIMGVIPDTTCIESGHNGSPVFTASVICVDCTSASVALAAG